jgi:Flp pilus assembly protein TadG
MIRRRLQAFLRAESGASAVEFAVVAVPLLLIVFGTFEYGRLQWTRSALQETAMAAARCMGVKQPACASGGAVNTGQTLSYLREQAGAFMVSLPSHGVTLDTNVSCSGVAGFSRVTIAYTYQTAVPLLLGSLADGIAIQTAACFPNQV